MAHPDRCQPENFAQVILGEARARVPLIDLIVTAATPEVLMTGAIERLSVEVTVRD